MKRFILTIAILFICYQGKAQQTGNFFLNPYYPEFSSSDKEEIPMIDPALQAELVRFSSQRQRVQALWLEHMPADPQLVAKDSFVLKRVLDRSVSRLSKSEFFKKSTVGRTANNIKDNLETAAEFNDSKNMKHKFDFKIALFQGQAFVQYSGFTKAQLRYDVSGGGTVAMIFQHDLGKNSIIGIESGLTGNVRSQLLTLNFIW